jgi:cell division transport system ATP-binding protein
MTVLRFDSVSKQYPGGHTALSEVSFAVDAGEMLFITGHSGAGKSTLLKLIHLSERPSSGAVLFGERNLRKVSGRGVAMHRRAVGVVYQDHRLLTDRTAAENVALPLILRGVRRDEIRKRVRSDPGTRRPGRTAGSAARSAVRRRAAARRHRPGAGRRAAPC